MIFCFFCFHDVKTGFALTNSVAKTSNSCRFQIISDWQQQKHILDCLFSKKPQILLLPLHGFSPFLIIFAVFKIFFLFFKLFLSFISCKLVKTEWSSWLFVQWSSRTMFFHHSFFPLELFIHMRSELRSTASLFARNLFCWLSLWTKEKVQFGVFYKYSEGQIWVTLFMDKNGFELLFAACSVNVTFEGVLLNWILFQNVRQVAEVLLCNALLDALLL